MKPEEMPDQQIIERLAEFTGASEIWVKNSLEEEDWNWWRQVEEKVMEDLDLFAKYCNGLLNVDTNQIGAMQHCIEADLPTRCKALCEVLNNDS